MSKIVEKVPNFLDRPLPRKIWTISNLGRNWFLMAPPPPPSTEIGKFEIVKFDIVEPPLTLAKTVPA